MCSSDLVLRGGTTCDFAVRSPFASVTRIQTQRGIGCCELRLFSPVSRLVCICAVSGYRRYGGASRATCAFSAGSPYRRWTAYRRYGGAGIACCGFSSRTPTSAVYIFRLYGGAGYVTCGYPAHTPTSAETRMPPIWGCGEGDLRIFSPHPRMGGGRCVDSGRACTTRAHGRDADGQRADGRCAEAALRRQVRQTHRRSVRLCR